MAENKHCKEKTNSLPQSAAKTGGMNCCLKTTSLSTGYKNGLAAQWNPYCWQTPTHRGAAQALTSTTACRNPPWPPCWAELLWPLLLLQVGAAAHPCGELQVRASHPQLKFWAALILYNGKAPSPTSHYLGKGRPYGYLQLRYKDKLLGFCWIRGSRDLSM